MFMETKEKRNGWKGAVGLIPVFCYVLLDFSGRSGRWYLNTLSNLQKKILNSDVDLSIGLSEFLRVASDWTLSSQLLAIYVDRWST